MATTAEAIQQGVIIALFLGAMLMNYITLFKRNKPIGSLFFAIIGIATWFVGTETGIQPFALIITGIALINFVYEMIPN